MKSKINFPVITASEMLKLFSFVDEYKNENEIASLLKISARVRAIWTFLYFTQYILLGMLILEMGKSQPTACFRLLMSILMIITSIIAAFLLNRWVYYPNQIIQYKYLNNFRSDINSYLSERGSRVMEGLVANYQGYVLGIGHVTALMASTSFTMIMLCLIGNNNSHISQLLWLCILGILILAFVSKIFWKNMEKMIEKLQKKRLPTLKNILVRATIPILPNMSESIVIPLISIGLSGQLTPILVVLAGVLSRAWYFTQQGTSILLSKKFLTQLNQELKTVSDRLIMNYPQLTQGVS
jgi:hypothetical protein